MAEKVRLSLQISAALNENLESLARDLEVTKTDVLRRAVALMMIGHDARKAGKAFGIANADTQKLEKEIIGL